MITLRFKASRLVWCLTHTRLEFMIIELIPLDTCRKRIEILQSISYRSAVRMKACAHKIHMRCTHESTRFKPRINHSPPGKGPVTFVFGGILAETAESAAKRPATIRIASRLTMLVAIQNQLRQLLGCKVKACAATASFMNFDNRGNLVVIE